MKTTKRRPRASDGQRYPLPCCTHFGNLKCAQQGKGYCGAGYLCQQCLAGSGRPVKDNPLWGFDAHLLVQLGVGEWKFDGFLDLLDLGIETADVGIRLLRRLFQFHHRYHRIRVVAQNTNDGVHFVVQQDRTAWDEEYP